MSTNRYDESRELEYEHAAGIIEANDSQVSAEIGKSPEEWDRLCDRRNSRGASEAPIIMGYSRFDTRLRLWSRTLGLTPQIEETAAMRIGHKMEPIVADEYCDDTGRNVIDPGPYTVFRNAGLPNMHATPDYVIQPFDGPDQCTMRGWTPYHGTPGCLETKDVGPYMVSEWEQAADTKYRCPIYVWAQLQHQMLVCGLMWGSVAARLAGGGVVWCDVLRDDEYIERELVPEVEKFQRLIDAEVAPAAVARDNQHMAELFPESEVGQVISLDVSFEGIARELKQAKQDEKDAKERADQYEALIKQAMGDAEAARLPSGVTFQWKTKTRNVKAKAAYVTISRVFRRLKD